MLWIDLDPTVGHEQAGRRPAVVLSRQLYNGRAKLAIICPITSRAKNYSFEIPLPADSPIHGVVLADHLKSVDWQSRRIEFIGKLPIDTIQEIADRLEALLLK